MLAAAAEIEWYTLYATSDTRQAYGEQRMVGIGYIGMRLFAVVYVDRDEVRRIISLRKANLRPVRQRGRPAGSGKKIQVTMRLDEDIIAAFKEDGDGWQTRMNDALRQWRQEHRR